MATTIRLTGDFRVLHSEERVAEMECQLLLSKFKNEATISRAEDKIRGTPGSHLAHRAGAFKLALRGALDAKRSHAQTDIIEGVMLQCCSTSCVGHSEHVSYSTVKPNGACPRCDVYLVQCVGCKSVRYDLSLVQCNSCGKKFL